MDNSATWVVQNNLDGVDFDMENLGPGLVYNGKFSGTIKNIYMDKKIFDMCDPCLGVSVITWLSDASNAAKSYMESHGRANVLVSHAPQGKNDILLQN